MEERVYFALQFQREKSPSQSGSMAAGQEAERPCFQYKHEVEKMNWR